MSFALFATLRGGGGWGWGGTGRSKLPVSSTVSVAIICSHLDSHDYSPPDLLLKRIAMK